MYDGLSSHLRLVSSQDDGAVSDAISLEIRTICRQAAEPVRPGESVKAQLLRAWISLGKPPFWRVKAGWHDDRVGGWSAAAVRDFQDRYRDLLERRRRLERHNTQKAALISGSQSSNTLEAARDELRLLRARIEAIETTLRLRP